MTDTKKVITDVDVLASYMEEYYNTTNFVDSMGDRAIVMPYDMFLQMVKMCQDTRVSNVDKISMYKLATGYEIKKAIDAENKRKLELSMLHTVSTDSSNTVPLQFIKESDLPPPIKCRDCGADMRDGNTGGECSELCNLPTMCLGDCLGTCYDSECDERIRGEHSEDEYEDTNGDGSDNECEAIDCECRYRDDHVCGVHFPGCEYHDLGL